MVQIIRDARLLFLYALGSKAKCEEVIGPDNFSCRLARRGDIGAIRDCNLKTLPENYTPDVSRLVGGGDRARNRTCLVNSRDFHECRSYVNSKHAT